MVSLVFNLAKDKIATCNINSHISEGVNSVLKRYIDAVSLEELEKRAKEKVEYPQYSIEIYLVKKQNPVVKFFSKILVNSLN